MAENPANFLKLFFVCLFIWCTPRNRNTYKVHPFRQFGDYPNLRPHSSLSDLNYSNAFHQLSYSGQRNPFRLTSIRLLQSELNLSAKQQNESALRSKSFSMFYGSLGNRSMDQNFPINSELSEWMRFQPLSILQLDPPDRVVLFIAGMFHFLISLFLYLLLITFNRLIYDQNG